MAAILARSTTASAVVSARRSQAEQPCVRRSVSAAAWQKAITEADLEKADVKQFVWMSSKFAKKINYESGRR